MIVLLWLFFSIYFNFISSIWCPIILVEMQSTEECADKLLQTAIDNGGKDNVTVVVLDFEKQSLINSILDYIK